MFDQTTVITYAIFLAGLALAGATIHHMIPFTRRNLRRLAFALVAAASASSGAYAQTAATAATSPATSPATAATATPALGSSRIYVSDWKGNRVRVFDPNPSQTPGTPHVGNILVGEGPFGMAVSPDSRSLYVANSGSDTVSVIDTRWNVVHYNVAVGDYPIRVAASPDGNRIFVTNFYGNSVSVVRVGSNTTPWVERTIPLPYKPMEVAVKPGGRYLYVSQYEDFKIKVFDIWNNFEQVDDISCTALGATQPIAFAFSADGGRLYVANEGGGPNAGGTVNFINSSNSAANVVERTVALPYQHLPRG
jgi:YVTN family beta-propeller protein